LNLQKSIINNLCASTQRNKPSFILDESVKMQSVLLIA